MNEELCPCQSGRTYAECCEAVITGAVKAATPEALMRARYSAYARHEIDFIIASIHPAKRDENDRGEIRRWSENSVWEGLEIIRTEGGGENDGRGAVEFKAHYREGGVSTVHHEIAEFRRVNGDWFFYDGALVPEPPYVRETPKVGRNDPCPCGSGKKYKKCCGQ